MSHLGEFELIGRIAALSHPEPGILGIGDDCAVLPQREGLDTLVTTDLLIEGRHFLLSDVTPEQLGWKSAAVNISDIAAMGGRPTASFLSIALPKGLAERFSPGPDPSENVSGSGSKRDDPTCGTGDGARFSAEAYPSESIAARGLEREGPIEDGRGSEATFSEGYASRENRSCWIDRFIKGYSELCGKFGVPLLGGDTSASPSELFINVTVIGECPHGKALVRSSARPGDLICVTGPLGDSAAGLKLILERAAAAEVSSEVQSGVPPTAKMAQNDAGGPSECTSGDTRGPLEAYPGTIGETSGPLKASPGTSDDTPGPEAVLIRRHYLPMPRVEEGIALRECPGVHAMMDISDGIASDLWHILEASGGRSFVAAAPQDGRGGVPQDDNPTPSCPDAAPVPTPVSGDEILRCAQDDSPAPLGAEIDLASLPLSPELRAVCAERGWDAAELAVSGGEDYELLVTMAPEALERARKALSGRLFVIGRIVEGGGIRWIGGNKDYKGFTHF